MRTTILAFLIIFSITGFTSTRYGTGRLKIELEDVPNNGALAVALFKSADGYPYNFNKAYKVKYAGVTSPKDSLYFDVPHGTYAVVVKWDEFYIRPDTLFIAYNHMQLLATSGNGKSDFKSSSIKFRKEEQTVKIKFLTYY